MHGTGIEEGGWDGVAAGEVVARSDYSVPAQLPPSLAQWRWPIEKVHPPPTPAAWGRTRARQQAPHTLVRRRAQVKDKIAQKMFNHTSRAADQLRQAFWIFGHENKV